MVAVRLHLRCLNPDHAHRVLEAIDPGVPESGDYASPYLEDRDLVGRMRDGWCPLCRGSLMEDHGVEQRCPCCLTWWWVDDATPPACRLHFGENTRTEPAPS